MNDHVGSLLRMNTAQIFESVAWQDDVSGQTLKDVVVVLLAKVAELEDDIVSLQDRVDGLEDVLGEAPNGLTPKRIAAIRQDGALVTIVGPSDGHEQLHKGDFALKFEPEYLL